VLDVMGERMVKRDFSAGIEARLHHKDYGLVLEAAKKIRRSHAVDRNRWPATERTDGAGLGRDDTSSLLRVLEAK
jgi:2-hydroxy-3-oxopropionate reductase